MFDEKNPQAPKFPMDLPQKLGFQCEPLLLEERERVLIDEFQNFQLLSQIMMDSSREKKK